jgi:hypothetical protein
MSGLRVRYRARQFWQAVSAVTAAEDLAQAEAVLTPPLMELFMRLQKSEQVHSLRLYRQLVEAGERQRDLLVAALLHDIGKSRFPLRLWERALIVIARAIFPASSRRWGQEAPRGWHKPFVVAEQHPAWGADLAAQAGASPLAVALIRSHQSPPAAAGDPAARSLEIQLLSKLQFLDEDN